MERDIKMDLSGVREDILTTLAIAALLTESDESVRRCAKRLIDYAPGSMAKSILRPMAAAKDALSIVFDEIIYAPKREVVGHAKRDGYEYDLVLSYHDDYDLEEVFAKVTEAFLSRGIVRGYVHITLWTQHRQNTYTRAINLERVAIDLLKAA